jgi:hypothetical protein
MSQEVVSEAPVWAAVISAAVAAGVAWFTARASFNTEVGKLTLGVQQKLLEQMVEKRAAVYPKLYSLLSDLPKAAAGDLTNYPSPRELFAKINEWDSQHSIFLGPHTTNVCWGFRQVLRDFAEDFPNLAAGAAVNSDVKERVNDLLKHAEQLELALRSDLGIYGVDVTDPKNLKFRTTHVRRY